MLLFKQPVCGRSCTCQIPSSFTLFFSPSHTFFRSLSQNPGPCAGLVGHMRLLTLRVPWQEQQSSVNPQGPRKGTPMPPRRFRCRGRWPLLARGSAVRPSTFARTRSSGACGPTCYCPRRTGAALEWHSVRHSAASLCNIVAGAAAARGMPRRRP